MKIQFSENNIRIRFSNVEALELVHNSTVRIANEFLITHLAFDDENKVTLHENTFLVCVLKNEFSSFLKSENERFQFQFGKTQVSIEKDLAFFRNGFSIQ
ncbi:MAG: hypothetical protein ACKO5Y_07870 [Bacteroidota bacterium]